MSRIILISRIISVCIAIDSICCSPTTTTIDTHYLQLSKFIIFQFLQKHTHKLFLGFIKFTIIYDQYYNIQIHSMEQNYITKVDRYLFGDSYSNQLHASYKRTNRLIYIRIACLIYLTAIYIWSLVRMDNIQDNVIYFTMESYFLTWVFFALTVEDYFANSPQKPEYFKGLWKMCSLLFQVALCAQVPVTLVFWGFLFKILLSMQGVTAQLIALNANLHAGPFICLTIDYYFNSINFRKRHYWLIFIFGALYMTFNMLYSLMYTPIYKPIDWVSLLSYGIVLGSFLSSWGVHILARKVNVRYKRIGIESKDTKEVKDGDSGGQYKEFVDQKQGIN